MKLKESGYTIPIILNLGISEVAHAEYIQASNNVLKPKETILTPLKTNKVLNYAAWNRICYKIDEHITNEVA